MMGIPNVGKSTFINRIAGTNRAQVGDKPGVTKGQQWVKITPYLELMDTPGLLWPKLEDPQLARHVAYIGSIKDDIMDTEELAASLLFDLMRICPEELVARYKKLEKDMAPEELLEGVCKSRGFVLGGGVLDTERAAHIVLDEFRSWQDSPRDSGRPAGGENALKNEDERLKELCRIEREYWNKGILPGGMDEVGRGPLAGPVVAACIVLPPEPLIKYVNDSKSFLPDVGRSCIPSLLTVRCPWLRAGESLRR